MKTLSDRIKYIRKDILSLSQEEFAEKLGIKTKVGISHWENGNSKPDVDQILKLSELSRKSVEWIITGVETHNENISKLKLWGAIKYGTDLHFANDLGLTLEELALYYSGIKPFDEELYRKLRRAGCDIETLFENSLPDKARNLPHFIRVRHQLTEAPEHFEVQIVGMVPAGHTDIYDEPAVEPPILLPWKEFKKCIAVRVDGNSMERLFYDGDILFIQERNSQIPRKDGFTYVIEWEEHEKLMRAVKNVYREKEGFRLVSENKIHRDIYIDNIRKLYRIVGVFNREFRYQMNV